MLLTISFGCLAIFWRQCGISQTKPHTVLKCPSQSANLNPPLFGCGGTGDSHHVCTADKYAATMWCCHANMDPNLWGMFPSLCAACYKEVKQFWRQKGAQPSTSQVYLIKWPVYLCVCVRESVCLHICTAVCVYTHQCMYVPTHAQHESLCSCVWESQKERVWVGYVWQSSPFFRNNHLFLLQRQSRMTPGCWEGKARKKLLLSFFLPVSLCLFLPVHPTLVLVAANEGVWLSLEALRLNYHLN